jgi:hypothetical protein
MRRAGALNRAGFSEGVMKRIGIVALLAVLSASASAQKGLPPEPMFCEPGSYPHDAVAAAPFSHRVLFEDEHVRVLEINLPALATEPIHIHALPSVIMGETGGGGGAKFRYTEYRMENGKFVETTHNDIEPSGGFRTVWSGPEGPHAITNTGQVGVKFTRIEIKPESCAK